MKTATKLRSIQGFIHIEFRSGPALAGLDYHIVQPPTAIRREAKEAGRSLTRQLRIPRSPHHPFEMASCRFSPAGWPARAARRGYGAVLRARFCKGKASAKRGKGEHDPRRTNEDGWRLRAADLNDIDSLHALAASPLVYQYLFDGAPPDKEHIMRRVAESVANTGETGLGMWFLQDASTRYAGCVELRPYPSPSAV